MSDAALRELERAALAFDFEALARLGAAVRRTTGDPIVGCFLVQPVAGSRRAGPPTVVRALSAVHAAELSHPSPAGWRWDGPVGPRRARLAIYYVVNGPEHLAQIPFYLRLGKNPHWPPYD